MSVIVHTCVECGKRINLAIIRGKDGEKRHIECHRKHEAGGAA